MTAKKVLIFGSSMNPPTIAHQKIIESFVNLKEFDEIIVLPVYKHIYSSKSGLLEYEVRMEMTKLAFENYDIVKVLELEKLVFLQLLKENGDDATKFKCGTYDILSYIRNNNPDIDLHIIVGGDAYFDICDGKWRMSDQLPKMAKFHVIQRDGVPTFESIKSTRFHEFVTLHQVPDIDFDISSTRARAVKSTEELKKIVPSKVARYIADNLLYSFQ